MTVNTRPHLPAVLVALLVSACASSKVTPRDERSPDDPWEPLNRTMYSVHNAVDTVSLEPVAKGYKNILPPFVRQGVTNFSRNLFVPRSIVNNFLQGKVEGGMDEFARLLINSTVGIGGLVDVSSVIGIEQHDETFRQTAAVWGVPEGPFVFIPILGPYTLSDSLFLPLDIAADPLWHYDNSSVRTKLYVLRIINLRSRLLAADKLLDESADRYVTMRESFLQNRLYEIHDGDPPVDDDFYDDFLDEDFEDDDFVDEPAISSEPQ